MASRVDHPPAHAHAHGHTRPHTHDHSHGHGHSLSHSHGQAATSSATAAAAAVAMSRGRQLEAAVENLSAWYFELDEPKVAWLQSERIHPLPEESVLHGAAASTSTSTSIGTTMTMTAPVVPASAATADVTSSTYPFPSSPAPPLHKNRSHQRSRGASGDEERKNRRRASLPQQQQLEPEAEGVDADGDGDAIGPRPRTSSRGRRARGARRMSIGSNGGTLASSTASTYTDLVVTGYTIRGSEKKVMYHIDVRGHESQLQTYTIRRSYTEFKQLHAALTDVLEARREYHARVTMRHQEKRPTTAAAAAAGDGSSMGMGGALYPSRGSLGQRSTLDTDDETLAALTGMDLHDRGRDRTPLWRKQAEPWFVSFTLPPLPHAGFLSYWRRHDRTHLQGRCEQFQEILRAAIPHYDLRECYAMQNFLSVSPCAIRDRGSSYVSLCEYSVPHLDIKVETRERKKMARERRRNSSALASFSSQG